MQFSLLGNKKTGPIKCLEQGSLAIPIENLPICAHGLSV